MFKKGKQKKAAQINTLIGQHSHIEGDINFSGGLRLEGSIVGNVNATDDTDSVLILGEESNITGDIRVPNLIINGTIVGNVYASEHVELAVQATITGNLYYSLLTMAAGSTVNGELIHMIESKVQLLDLEQGVNDSDDPLRIKGVVLPEEP